MPMPPHPRTFVLVSLVCFGAAAHAQAVPVAPQNKSEVAEWDAKVVDRAMALLATPAQWSHADPGDCPAHAQTFSIICALQQATDDAAHSTAPRAAAGSPVQPATCVFRTAVDHREGSCGLLFDELPIFNLKRATAVKTGAWRADVKPVDVWAGVMIDAGSPVMDEARQAVAVVTTKKYSARLIDYNNDSTTTFADVQKFLHLVRERVLANAASDFGKSPDDVEIEVYAGGTGVIRTYTGWFAISGFSATDSTIRFQIDTAREIPPSALDREILKRAAATISSDAVWNRADNRKCSPTATTWSIYCAVERAEIELAGAAHHRRPAQELVREIIEARTKTKKYEHRLMEYNNDPSTTLDDVRSLFAEAIGRIKQ
jgi:hypothetical protein